MKTLVVPIDFTETSNNAVDYAVEWCRKFQYQRIILLKTFYDTLFDDVVISLGYGTVSQDFRSGEREETDLYLQQLHRDLSLKNKEIEVLTVTSELPLIRAIHEVIEEEEPDTIIVGSDTNTYDSDSYVAGHVIQIARISPVNVLVVPAGHRYQPVKEVLVPVDTFSMASLDKINTLSGSAFWNQSDFKVLRINPGGFHSKDSEQTTQSEEQMHSYLKHFHHQLYHASEKNIIDAIMNFLANNSVQLIIALPGKYSFLYRLTRNSISDAICRNTEKPVLILK